MKKLVLTLVAFIFMAGVIVQLPSALSKSPCEGLKKTKCEKTKGCQWITPKDKTAYCRLIPK
jgi:hypothetical protein